MEVESCPAETIPRRISINSQDFFSSTQPYCPTPLSTSLPLNSSTYEFELDVRINNIDQECYHSSADELFSNGEILPFQIKKQPSQKPQASAGKARSKNQTQSYKSFRQFNRSSSSNFVSGYNKPGLCPSTILSRGSSTLSAPKVKPGPSLRELGNHRQIKNYQKDKSLPCLQSSTSNQKPPLKKSFTYVSHGNGVTINPILNVPLVDVCCLSTIFFTGKDRKK